MRNVLCCVLLFMVACAAEGDLELDETEADLTTAERQTLVVFNPRATVQHYWRYVPADYATSGTKRYPLIVFLHGLGEKGTRDATGSCLASADLVKRQGPPKKINLGTWSRTEFVVVSPQNCNTGWWTAAEVESVVADAIAHNRIDTTRIYLTGLSAGGAGVLKYVNAHPERVAAALTADGANQSSADYCQGLTQVPLWLFHNRWDRRVVVGSSRAVVNGVDACPGTPPEAPSLTIYETPTEDQCLCATYPCGKCHDGWTRTYDTNHIYDWMLAHRKGSATTSHPFNVENGGSSTFVASDGKRFVPDIFYVGGTSNTAHVGAAIASTTDDPLFTTYRTGATSYHIPLAKGRYIVRLGMAELEKTAAGQRVFDVIVEGAVHWNDLDIFRLKGAANALITAQTIPVTDGWLDLELVPVVGSPILSALTVQYAGQ